MIFRIAYHMGFGGTHTAETDEPVKFVRDLYRQGADWVEYFGCFEKKLLP